MKRVNLVLFATTLVLLTALAVQSLMNSSQTVHGFPMSGPSPVVEVVVPPPSRPHETLDLPEYRPAPVQKYYRPQASHQVGLLRQDAESESDGDVRPIYAKPVRGRRDRWHYWSTTGNGHNNYAVPLTLDGRDCTEDIGCQEMYGNESVSLWDNPEVQYKSYVNRVDRFF